MCISHDVAHISCCKYSRTKCELSVLPQVNLALRFIDLLIYLVVNMVADQCSSTSNLDMKSTNNSSIHSGRQSSTPTKPPTPKVGNNHWGYVIVASVFVVNLAVLGWFQSQTFFFVEWQREFKYTSIEASVLVSIGLLVFGLCSKFIS